MTLDVETPRYDLGDFPEVYDPAEDTFLFLDALEKDRRYIEGLNPRLACEVGCGSGVVITALATMLKQSCAYFSTDVNLQACLATQKTASINGVVISVVNMDLLSFFKLKFDVILFNPPYVVTDSSETLGTGLNRAWAGGADGREIVDQFLEGLATMLSHDGVCYMVLLKENRIGEIEEFLGVRGMKSEMVLERRVPGEHLFVYKFFWG